MSTMQLLTVFTEALYHIQIVSYYNGIKPANFNQKKQKTNKQRTDKISMAAKMFSHNFII